MLLPLKILFLVLAMCDAMRLLVDRVCGNVSVAVVLDVNDQTNFEQTIAKKSSMNGSCFE